MKTMLLILIAGLLTVGATAVVDADKVETPIPAWYYDSPCQQPVGTTLHDWLANLDVPYEITSDWNCSQTAAWVEWMTENCGHETIIMCNNNHCWVEIEGNSYETTSLGWGVNEQHKATKRFIDINGAWAWTEVNGLSQWGWWVTHPELRGR